MNSHIGQQLGNYRLHRLLGQGGFADVYLGEHIHLRTQAAIKVMQMRLVESNIQSFLNEARTIAHLVHPYIIRVLDFGVEGDIPFLVMDYAPKGTFRQRFLQGRPLPPRSLFIYMKQVASALQYAHDQKLIHRDVKPENILLGSKEEVLLSDFGLALIQTSISHAPSVTVGTGAYMAPEQLQGKPMPASDQYALGIIAYEWITGTCPFLGSFFEMASQHMLVSPPAFRHSGLAIPAEIEQVVMTALAKEPSQRFPNVSDFVQALECACLLTNKTFYHDTSVVPSPLASSFPNHLSGQHEQLRQASILRDLSQQGLPLSQGQIQLPNRKSLSSLSGSSVPLGQVQIQQSNRKSLSSLSGSSLLSGNSSLTLGLKKQNEQTNRLSSPFSMQPPSPSVNISPLDINRREQGPVVGSQSSMHSAQRPNLSPVIASAKGNTSPALSHSDLKVSQGVRLSRPKSSSAGWVLPIFIIAMLAVIIGSTTLLLFLTSNKTRTPPIATPITTTQNVVATPTSATILNPYGDHKGLLVLNSALSQQDPQVHWEEQKDACEFADNSYHVIAGVQTRGFTVCHATASNYTNFVYQVQMTFMRVSAIGSSGGLVFRANKASQQFYFLEFFSSGHFAFYRCPGVNGAACPLISSSTVSGIGALPSFNTTLEQPNTIAILANEKVFTIYVNNQLAIGPIADSITNQVISQGTIGMMARQGRSGIMADIKFSNVKIWKL